MQENCNQSKEKTSKNNISTGKYKITSHNDEKLTSRVMDCNPNSMSTLPKEEAKTHNCSNESSAIKTISVISLNNINYPTTTINSQRTPGSSISKEPLEETSKNSFRLKSSRTEKIISTNSAILDNNQNQAIIENSNCNYLLVPNYTRIFPNFCLIYDKYRQRFAEYISKYKKSVKLYGNKKYANKSTDYYLSERNNIQNNPNINTNTNPHEHKKHTRVKSYREIYLIKTGKNGNENIANNIQYQVIHKNQTLDLTPMPAKSRRKMKNHLEKTEFLEMERSVAAMRRFEYNNKLNTLCLNVIKESYRSPSPEVIQKCIVIQRWWKNIFRKLNSNAIKIQSAFRGFIIRSVLKDMSEVYATLNEKIGMMENFLKNKLFGLFFKKLKEFQKKIVSCRFRSIALNYSFYTKIVKRCCCLKRKVVLVNHSYRKKKYKFPQIIKLQAAFRGHIARLRLHWERKHFQRVKPILSSSYFSKNEYISDIQKISNLQIFTKYYLKKSAKTLLRIKLKQRYFKNTPAFSISSYCTKKVYSSQYKKLLLLQRQVRSFLKGISNGNHSRVFMNLIKTERKVLWRVRLLKREYLIKVTPRVKVKLLSSVTLPPAILCKVIRKNSDLSNIIKIQRIFRNSIINRQLQEEKIHLLNAFHDKQLQENFLTLLKKKIIRSAKFYVFNQLKQYEEPRALRNIKLYLTRKDSHTEEENSDILSRLKIQPSRHNEIGELIHIFTEQNKLQKKKEEFEKQCKKKQEEESQRKQAEEERLKLLLVRQYEEREREKRSYQGYHIPNQTQTAQTSLRKAVMEMSKKIIIRENQIDEDKAIL